MVASMVCVIDTTTILGSRDAVNRLDDEETRHAIHAKIQGPSLRQGEKKTQAQLQAPKRVRDGAAPRPAKWAQRGVQNPQNELCKHSTRHPTCPLGRPLDKAGWEQPRACKKGPVWGTKSPKQAAQAQHQASHMPSGQANG
ncbi:hypothetical protein B0H14DRAFT_2652808 [Mycena olivaceomarginata]|nr:hypothetical protein B0H14DRAFT_2652808 [Mycena olivaceomarginata]